jgi:hypothetical protein
MSWHLSLSQRPNSQISALSKTIITASQIFRLVLNIVYTPIPVFMKIAKNTMPHKVMPTA